MRKQIPIIFFVQTVALTIAAVFFRNSLNTDAVAYLQLARHYSNGNFGLAISGHWSPLISWILALLLKIGLPSLVAGRFFMIASAIFFLFGSLQLFQKFELPRRFLIGGLWTMALLSIPWSVEAITPDLLLAGLVGWAFSKMIAVAGSKNAARQLSSGIIWGIAFLCKSIALPLGILTAIGMAVWQWKKKTLSPIQIAKTFAITIFSILMIAGVWIGVLSAHYDKFTVANSAAYNHSLVGPDVSRPMFLLDHGIQKPAAGRITIWEDPWPPYPNWSPFSSLSNAVFQLKIILRNVPIILFMLTGLSLFFPVLIIWIVIKLLRGKTPIKINPAVIPICFLAILFLPNYLLFTEERYFYCAAPLLFVAVTRCDYLKKFGVLWLAVAFLIPTMTRAGLFLNSTRSAGDCAHFLAEKIARKQLAGPLVGSGKLSGGRVGLDVAFLLQQPWYGDEPSPSALDYKKSGAKLIVVNRDSLVAVQLADSSRARNLDSTLFDRPEQVDDFPIQVYEVISH